MVFTVLLVAACIAVLSGPGPDRAARAKYHQSVGSTGRIHRPLVVDRRCVDHGLLLQLSKYTGLPYILFILAC